MGWRKEDKILRLSLGPLDQATPEAKKKKKERKKEIPGAANLKIKIDK